MSEHNLSEVDSTILSLDSFVIHELHVESKPSPSSPSDSGELPIVLNISCDSNIRIHKQDPLKYVIKATYNIVPKGEYGWWISTVVQGFFTCKPTIPEENRNATVALFGHTLLWGTLRGYILSMSGPFPKGSFMLPTIDMMQLLSTSDNNTDTCKQ